MEEVTDSLYNKGVKFLMEHDLKLTLPELFFHGTTLKVSPRALTKTGALVHIDLEPKEDDVGQGRIFFHKISMYKERDFLGNLILRCINLFVYFIIVINRYDMIFLQIHRIFLLN